MNDGIFTLGIDVGGSYIKALLMKHINEPTVIDKRTEKIRKRNPVTVAEEMLNLLLEKNKLKQDDIAYLASTGEGEMVARKTGHFYSMTTHARGGILLNPGVKTVVDMGALFVRAIKVNNFGKVLDYKLRLRHGGVVRGDAGQHLVPGALGRNHVGEISLQS